MWFSAHRKFTVLPQIITFADRLARVGEETGRWIGWP